MLAQNSQVAKKSKNQNVQNEQYIIAYNSPLYRFVEHSLLPYKFHLDGCLRELLASHNQWSSSYVQARVPVLRIVCLQSKCIVLKKSLATRNLKHIIESYRRKLAHMMHLIRPHQDKLHATTAALKEAIVRIKEINKQVVEMVITPGIKSIIFYHKWNVGHFINFINGMLEAYKWDLKMRSFIEARIITVANKEELNSYQSCWLDLHKNPKITEYKISFDKFEKEMNSK